MKLIKIFMAGAALLLLSSGLEAATMQTQKPLNPLLIPKFVEPLPLLEFEFINATSGPLDNLLSTLPAKNGEAFPIDAYEFRSQILPRAANWPTAPATCGADTASSTFGYISDSARHPGIHETYLGPVVIAERGITARPTYGNKLPLNGEVQKNLPIDQTLDWANPEGFTGPDLCIDPITRELNPNNTFCNNIPYAGPMPIATHLHGGEVAPAYDGGPDAWFTPDFHTNPPLMDGTPDGQPDYKGPGYPGATYEYPNNQQEGLIWFHDHALGITRLNVYAGLAGIMPIIDPPNTPKDSQGKFLLPQLTDGYHVPLIIQDRTFDENCEIMYNLASNPQPNPTVHPFWIPEFIGDTIAVNGKTWPYFEVEPRQYRFSFVNGSNARFYDLSLSGGLKFYVIATDDGYLQNAVRTGNLIIGPGERYEVIVDFKNVKGQKNQPFPKVTMTNIAATPFPAGAPVVPGLTDTVMQFWVNQVANFDPATGVPDTQVGAGTVLRDPLTNPIYPIVNGHNPATGSITRQLTLNEVIGKGGPLELVVNNSKFNLPLNLPDCNTASCRESEMPAVGDTEIWEIINITADAHPMHTHLTSFQVLDRTPFKAAPWIASYDGFLRANGVPDGGGPPNNYSTMNADGAIGGNPAVGPFLITKNARPPLAYEMGWKDTVITYPGEVTRIAVRWAPTDIAVGGVAAGDNRFDDFPNGGFDPTSLAGDNVGYVWHCHIVDHEDNEMMRNYTVGATRQYTCDPAVQTCP
jgi:FtsP/CotA-like multicopper oxidase with cupredoxin domain